MLILILLIGTALILLCAFAILATAIALRMGMWYVTVRTISDAIRGRNPQPPPMPPTAHRPNDLAPPIPLPPTIHEPHSPESQTATPTARHPARAEGR